MLYNKSISVGDIHDKVDVILPFVDKTLDETKAATVILLGDYPDDWEMTGNDDVAALQKLASWVQDKRERGVEVVTLIGNHDFAYLFDAPCSGTKPAFADQIRPLLVRLDAQIAYAKDDVLYTHAGLTQTWAAQAGINRRVSAEEAASRINDLLMTAEGRSLLNQASSARGGSGVAGPLWADKKDLAEDAMPNLIQVVGHTPVKSATELSVADRDAKIVLCDTFSTTRDGRAIGDGSILVTECTKDGLIFDTSHVCTSQRRAQKLSLINLPEHMSADDLELNYDL